MAYGGVVLELMIGVILEKDSSFGPGIRKPAQNWLKSRRTDVECCKGDLGPAVGCGGFEEQIRRSLTS